MFDFNYARAQVLDFINQNFQVPNDTLTIIDNKTLEKEYGWIFFYNSSKYLETGDISYLIAGNAPVLFEKSTGNIIKFGTAFPLEHYLEEYENMNSSA